MAKKQKAPKEPPTITISSTNPKREGFSIAGWRAAIKQAENVQSPRRGQLLDLYNEIFLDTHLESVVGKRLGKIASTPFRYVLPGGKNDEVIDKILKGALFREMASDWLSSKFWGPTAHWVEFSEGTISNYELFPRKHYRPETGEILSKPADSTGVNINEGNYPLYTMQVGRSSELGGLVRSIPWVLLKRGDVSDWATFLELFSFPFRLAKYPDYNTEVKDALAKACSEAVSNGFAVIPESTNLEFIYNQAKSSADAFENFATFCDKQISKSVLHNTLTTDAEGGAYKGEVHQHSEEGVFAADRQFILDILNGRFRELLIAHGIDASGGEFIVEDIDNTPLIDRINIDEKLVKIIEIPAEYFYKRYNVPVPKGGAKLIEQGSTTSTLRDIDILTAEVERLRKEADDRKLELKDRPRNFFD